MANFPPEWVANFSPESVANFDRNRWPTSPGIRTPGTGAAAPALRIAVLRPPLRGVRARAAPSDGPTYFLDDGLEPLQREVAAHTQGAVVLPAFEPSPGSSWLAMLVRCAVCDQPRLDVRAYRVDLTAELARSGGYQPLRLTP